MSPRTRPTRETTAKNAVFDALDNYAVARELWHEATNVSKALAEKRTRHCDRTLVRFNRALEAYRDVILGQA